MYPLPYDLLKDFEPVALSRGHAVDDRRARSDLPAEGFKELIAWLKANPDKASAGTVGAGSGAHVCRHLFPAESPARAFNSCPIAAPRR